MINFITNGIAWILKNGNMLVGVVSALAKLVVAFLNIFQPSKDKLVDSIESWAEMIQKGIFNVCEILKKFPSSTK